MENTNLINQLKDFGFSDKQAELALILADNNLELAANIASENSEAQLQKMVDEMEEEGEEDELDEANMFGQQISSFLQENQTKMMLVI